MRDSRISVRLHPELLAQKHQPAQKNQSAALAHPVATLVSDTKSARTAFMPAFKKDEVHFSGKSSGNQPISLKKTLQTLLMATMVGSGISGGANAFRFYGQPHNKGKDLQAGGLPLSQPNLPTINPLIAPGFPEHSQPVRHAPQPTPSATGGKQEHSPAGKMLESPMEAIYLAKTGQIMHAPDAVKVITGPGNQKLLYELKLKSGEIVGLSVPHDEMAHEDFLRELKGEHITPKPVPPQESTLWNMGNRIIQEAMPLLMVMGLVRLMGGIGNMMGGISNLPGVGGDDSSAGPRLNRVSQKKDKAPEEKPVTFADVRGYPEVIKELKRVKERYLLGNLERGETKIKVKPIKGMLLEGPPGTGKSMMAKALANESNVPFFYASGSQFVEMYVGVGAARVRQLFASAKKAADKHGGAIIFIDELDAVGGKRSDRPNNGGSEESTRTLNELLQQMSGFSDDPRIMVLGATNLKANLDDALIRSGRFDKSIKVDLPHDKEQRLDILNKYLDEHPTAAKLDRDLMAEFTSGKSGADLANLVNQMAEVAVDRITEARDNPAKKAQLEDPEFHKLNTRDFLDAMRNMEMGIKREASGTHDERKTVAVHEVVGHGLVARAAKTPVHIVSMQPRGNALGHVITDPRVASRKMPTLESILKDLVISMGGRASEREMLGAEKITPGASGDIAQSKAKIRQMLATRMLHQASGADINSHSALNEHDRKLADSLLKDAERTAEEVIRTVPREKLWALVDKAMKLDDELEGDEANQFYQELIDTVGVEKLYEPIQKFIQKTVEPKRPHGQELKQLIAEANRSTTGK